MSIAYMTSQQQKLSSLIILKYKTKEETLTEKMKISLDERHI
jgi:hypothetical protein